MSSHGSWSNWLTTYKDALPTLTKEDQEPELKFEAVQTLGTNKDKWDTRPDCMASAFQVMSQGKHNNTTKEIQVPKSPLIQSKTHLSSYNQTGKRIAKLKVHLFLID